MIQTVPPIENLMDLIHQQSNWCYTRMARPMSYEYDDVVQEGCLCYAKTVGKFDPSRGIKFITLFHLSLRRALAGVLSRSYRTARVAVVEFDGQEEGRAETEYRMEHLFGSRLSRGAMILCREILQPSKRFIKWCDKIYRYGLPKSMKLRRVAAGKFLGYDRIKMRLVCKEIGEGLGYKKTKKTIRIKEMVV